MSNVFVRGMNLTLVTAIAMRMGDGYLSRSACEIHDEIRELMFTTKPTPVGLWSRYYSLLLLAQDDRRSLTTMMPLGGTVDEALGRELRRQWAEL